MDQACQHKSYASQRFPNFSRNVVARAATEVASDPSPSSKSVPVPATNRSHVTDFVVIGSGIGGLCCAALLAKYGHSVTVVESHYLAGGAAHSFEVQGYHFDAGPSFFLGLTGPKGASINPLKQVLDAVGETIEAKSYDRWMLYSPGAEPFPVVANRDAYRSAIAKHGGPGAVTQWDALEKEMRPLQDAAGLFPAAAIRTDPGVLLTAARFMGPQMMQMPFIAPRLTGPFSAVVDTVVTDPWLRSLMDLECFVLSGMTAAHTLTAEMAFMFSERTSGRSAIEYPMGGSASIVGALVRGIEKHGGRVVLRAHVEEVVVEGGRAVGVRLRGGAGSSRGEEVIRARKGPSCSPPNAVPQAWRTKSAATPQTDSFVHLHLGIDATGLPKDLDCHHLVVDKWEGLTEPQNVSIVSIPTVFDPALAPPGKAVVHAYYAASEPYALWEGLARGTPQYAAMKEERAQPLWQALERIIPDIRARTELTLVASPLTHARFLRRDRGTYGPAISAGDSGAGGWPGPNTPCPGLYMCGDSTMPGIGVPAAAASGVMAANGIAPVWDHLKMMDEMLGVAA
ncbi:MAG: hypothetical protein WDW36_005059 [Sanguina aurantia]